MRSARRLEVGQPPLRHWLLHDTRLTAHLDMSSSPLSACMCHAAARVSPWNFMYAVERNPCFRQSLMWGIGVGAAMAGHSAIRHRQKNR